MRRTESLACLAFASLFSASTLSVSSASPPHTTSADGSSECLADASSQGGGGRACTASQSLDSIADSSRGKCNVDVLPAATFTLELFEEEYFLKKPVIVSGVTASPSGEGWSVESLRARHGGVPVKLGTSTSITKTHGSANAAVPLADFVDFLVAQEGQVEREQEGDEGGQGREGGLVGSSESDVYAFERDAAIYERAPELLESIRLTAEPFFGPLAGAGDPAKMNWYFSLGGHGSGTQLHHHGDGWCYLLEGAKRWFFYESMPPITHTAFMSMRYWLEEGVYPKLLPEEKPIECLQKEGDLIYIPEGWYHATFNSARPATLSVAAQQRESIAPYMRALNAAHAAKPAEAVEMLLNLTREEKGAYEEDPTLWFWIGYFYSNLSNKIFAFLGGNKEEELEARLKVAHLMKNRSCSALLDLANTLHKFENREMDAHEYLQKGLALCGTWDFHLWRALSTNLAKLGLSEDAETVWNMSRTIQTTFASAHQVQIGDADLLL